MEDLFDFLEKLHRFETHLECEIHPATSPGPGTLFLNAWGDIHFTYNKELRFGQIRIKGKTYEIMIMEVN